MTVNIIVKKIRELLKEKNLSAYIINSTDPHDSEYTADYWKVLEFVTGFTGGEGTAVITMDEAFIWVDSRYFIQCKKEIKGTCFKMKMIDGPKASSYFDYLCEKFTENEKIAIDSQTLMLSEFRKFKAKKINIYPTKDLVAGIWTDRPAFPTSRVYERSSEFCKDDCETKIKRIREELQKDNAQYTLISSLDDIAWILNLRANDLPYIPVFYSYLLIGLEDVVLFTPKKRFQVMPITELCYTIKEYDEIFNYLKKLTGTVVLNPKRINVKLFSSLKHVNVLEKREYSTDFKAVKDEKELYGLIKAQALDSIALIKLFYFIEMHAKETSELGVSRALETFKKETDENYKGPSFETISAFKENGAIVHYAPGIKTDKKLDSDGLLVLDCGSQMEGGTTDTTRTILIGKATKEQKRYYTAVLKGHIQLALTTFPKGTSGMQLDAIARREIWKVHQNFYHGTGHGVGSFLSVHEGPQRISIKGSEPLKENMLITNEPGIYLENKFGIRIENLMVVLKEESDSDEFYKLYSMTHIPYERRLINKSQLSFEEIAYINSYHEFIFNTYKSCFTGPLKKYFRKITRPI